MTSVGHKLNPESQLALKEALYCRYDRVLECLFLSLSGVCSAALSVKILQILTDFLVVHDALYAPQCP